MDILPKVEGLNFVHFDEADVVRHHLVQRIIRAYDEHKTHVAEQQMLLLSGGKHIDVRGAESKSALESDGRFTASGE
jgi:phosphate starvation-inducible PhoH-like protein